MEMRDVFVKIYDDNKWQGSQSGSGPGSSLAVTAPIREALPSLLRSRDVSVLLDAPCGDFQWMQAVDLPVTHYIGVDVVPKVIESNQQRFAERGEFLVGDITVDPLPQADLVLCRDCLVHLTAVQAFAAVRNMKASGASYLLATTFFALERNGPGSTGGWRPINLRIEPFCFPPPLELIRERHFDPERAYSDKSLGLWRLNELPEQPAE